MNIQMKSKKFFLQAGQEETIEPATFRLSVASLTCSSVQHTGPVDHVSPHKSTSLDRSASVGCTVSSAVAGNLPLLPHHYQGMEAVYRRHQPIRTTVSRWLLKMLLVLAWHIGHSRVFLLLLWAIICIVPGVFPAGTSMLADGPYRLIDRSDQATSPNGQQNVSPVRNLLKNCRRADASTSDPFYTTIMAGPKTR